MPRRVATQLQQGQSVVVSTLQQKFNSTAGVNIDTEMANLIQVQNTYAANAHIMSVVQSMMQSLLQAQRVRRSDMSISSINYGSSLLGQSVQNINKQLADLSTQLSSGVKSTDLCRHGRQRGLRHRRALAARQHLRLRRHHDQRQHDHQRGQHRAAVVVADLRPGAGQRGGRRRRT